MATIQFNDIAKSRRSIIVTNPIWNNPTPQMKKHAAEPLKDPDDVLKVC